MKTKTAKFLLTVAILAIAFALGCSGCKVKTHAISKADSTYTASSKSEVKVDTSSATVEVEHTTITEKIDTTVTVPGAEVNKTVSIDSLEGSPILVESGGLIVAVTSAKGKLNIKAMMPERKVPVRKEVTKDIGKSKIDSKSGVSSTKNKSESSGSKSSTTKSKKVEDDVGASLQAWAIFIAVITILIYGFVRFTQRKWPFK